MSEPGSENRWLVLVLSALIGASAGAYLLFGNALLHTQGKPAAWLLGPASGWVFGLAAVAAWFLIEGSARIGQKLWQLSLAQARWLAGLCWWPLSLLGGGLVVYPWLAKFGAKVNLTVLGYLQWPGLHGFYHATPAQYGYLLWAGPWITLPWFLIWGVSCWRFWQRLAARPATRIRKRWLLVAALAFYIPLGAWTSLVYPPTGDEPHYLLMAHSLLHDHDLDLRNNMEQRDYLAFYPGVLDFHAAPSPEGKMVSKHFPFFSLLLVPAYALLGRFGAILVILLTAAALGCLLFQWALAWGAGRLQAFGLWALMVVSPPLALYFDLVYYELPATLILLYGLWLWLRGGKWGQTALALAAVLLPFIHLKYIPLSFFLGLLLPWTEGTQPRDWWRPGLVVLAGLTGFYFYFHALYQFSLADNPYGQFNNLWSKATLVNLLGVWVDRDFGIFLAAPVLFIACLGVAVRRLSRRALVAFGGVFLVNYGVVGWFEFSGSSASYSRYMIPGTLLLWVFLSAGWQSLTIRWPQSRRWLLGLAVWGAGVSWVCLACPLLRYLSPKQKFGAVLGKSFALFPSLAAFPTWGDVAWAAGWVAVLALVLVYWIKQVKTTTSLQSNP